MCTGAGSPFPLIKASKIMKVEAAVSDVVGEEEWAALRSNVVRIPSHHTLYPTPYTLRPTPYTLRPKHYTLHLTPFTPHPDTKHPTPYTLHPTPLTPHAGCQGNGSRRGPARRVRRAPRTNINCHESVFKSRLSVPSFCIFFQKWSIRGTDF
jgi:hypothetical protein